MPSSARKNSVGRARTHKAHIPYRGDNPEVGKKTGIAVQHVERKSDGFEPFEEILQQADVRTPPRPKGRKKSLAAVNPQDDDYDDEDGEASMQLDSPLQHLSNFRPPTTPVTMGQNRSSIRPVARTSEIDYNKIPSPGPISSVQRGRNGVAGPSRLSMSSRNHNAHPEPDFQDDDLYDYGDMDNDQSGFDHYDPQESPKRPSPRKSSFSQIDEEDEQQEEEEEVDNVETPRNRRDRNRPNSKRSTQIDEEGEPDEGQRETPRNKSAKKKSSPRQVHRDPEHDEEHEIAEGLDNVDLEPNSEAEEEPRPKKAKSNSNKKENKGKNTETKAPRKATKSKKENEPERTGTRKSQRQPMAPLEYWRGERLIYGRTEELTGPVLVPPIKEILRIPKEEVIPLGKRKRGSRARSKSRTVEHIVEQVVNTNPEEDWDKDTNALCTVMHFTTQEEVERRIAWTAKMVEPKMAANLSWSFDKIFTDEDFIAAGQLIIPPDGRKPSKAAKDNTYVFYVIEGAVNFKIHQTSMVLSTGGMFMVPRGNMYMIENLSDRPAKLFFTQARKIEMNKEELAARADHIAATERRKSLVRSSSAGAPTNLTPIITRTGRATSMAVGLSE